MQSVLEGGAYYQSDILQIVFKLGLVITCVIYLFISFFLSFLGEIQVYLFIASWRIAGCLVAEPIKEAFKVIPHAEKEKPTGGIMKAAIKRPATLQFGNAIFQREAIRRAPPVAKDKVLDESLMGAIFCEEEAVPAVCGIRAVWVTPSNRRKHIATHLLDAAR